MMVHMHKDDDIPKDAVDDDKRVDVHSSESLEFMALGFSYFGIFAYCFDMSLWIETGDIIF